MNKLLTLFFFISAHVLTAQPFQARDLTIGMGSGVQILAFDMSDTAGYANRVDGLTGINFAMRGEYGLAPFMGISATFSHSQLLSETNSGGAQCSVTEFAPKVTYHLPWQNRFVDLGAAVGIGLSGYRYQSFENNWARTNISSSLFLAEFSSHFYFSAKNRLGAYASYRYSYYFGYGESSDKTTPRFEYNAIGHSHTCNLGLFWRFGSSREQASNDINNQ